jgi:hypothetical protein
LSIAIHFQDAIKENQIFSRAKNSKDGLWITNPECSLDYAKSLEYEILQALGRKWKEHSSDATKLDGQNKQL